MGFKDSQNEIYYTHEFFFDAGFWTFLTIASCRVASALILLALTNYTWKKGGNASEKMSTRLSYFRLCFRVAISNSASKSVTTVLSYNWNCWMHFVVVYYFVLPSVFLRLKIFPAFHCFDSDKTHFSNRIAYRSLFLCTTTIKTTKIDI
jgi:hypothetical protein